MNNDLISRSALFQKIQPVDFLYGHDEDAPYSGMAVDASDVEAAPAVDAVPVVRCEKCIHNAANLVRDPLDTTDYSGKDIVCAFWLSDGLEPDDYCSRGKMKGGSL